MPLHPYIQIVKKNKGVFVSESIEAHAEEHLFVDWNHDENGPQTVSPEIMDIIRTHFPEGELILSMENTRALVIQCAGRYTISL